MVVDMFQQSGPAETAKAAEIGGQTKTTQADAASTSSAPHLVHYV